MLHRLMAAACVALLAGAATGRADDKVNETLKRYFPDRDLTRAAVKIVDHANGIIAAGDALEVTKDGLVRTTNAVVILLDRGLPNGPQQPWLRYEHARATLQFAKPIRMPSDMAGNRLVSFGPAK